MCLRTVTLSSFRASFPSIGGFSTFAFALFVSLFLFALTSCRCSTGFLFRCCVLGAFVVGLKYGGAAGRSGAGALPFDFGLHPSKACQCPLFCCLCIGADSLFAIVPTALLAIAILRRRQCAFLFAFLQDLSEDFIFVVSRSAVHCRAAFAERLYTCSTQSIPVFPRFVGLFRKRAFACVFAVLRVPHG